MLKADADVPKFNNNDSGHKYSAYTFNFPSIESSSV